MQVKLYRCFFVFQGKFSPKSDVWSFGVTTWEILTLAREQPFCSLSDDDVIANCTHYFQSDGRQQCLQQPLYCTKEIYDLLLSCWQEDSSARPNFADIHRFLQQKIVGFDPRDENCAPFSTLPLTLM